MSPRTQQTQAKFLTGSTMRHVVVMTMTGSLGLSFMFLVDFLALFWISKLEQEELIAAVGFASAAEANGEASSSRDKSRSRVCVPHSVA